MKKSYVIAIGVLAGVGIILLIIVGIMDYQKQKETKEQEVAKSSLITDAEQQIGGEIIKEGFNITYESGQARFIITVTKEPFGENKQKALDYLEGIGIKTCDLNYLALPARGINTDGSQSTPINTCGIGE